MQLVAALFGQREANQPTRVTGHEIDDFRRYLFRRTDQIALIFAVFVVHDNDHAPFANVSSSVGDGSKLH
jgi:hypothetical protein